MPRTRNCDKKKQSTQSSSSSSSESDVKQKRRHRKKESSSSSDSSCSSNSDNESILSDIKKIKNKKVVKKIDCLAEKIKKNEKQDKCVEEKLENNIEHLECNIEKLEHKLEHNIDKLEHNIEHLEHKLKKNSCLDKKWRLKYRTVVERLRKEKCLMVNGCDAYGSFYSFTPQSIAPNSSVVFEAHTNVLNLQFVDGTTNIQVLRAGIYNLNITCQFDQPCQVAFFVNGNPDLTTVTASNSGAHIVTVHQLLSFNVGDFVSFRNYISNVTITTSIPASGLIANSQNVDFTMYRIAPLPEPCCLPPCLNKKAWCDFESDCESEHESCSSDSDSDSSHSSKFCSSEKSHKKSSKKCKKSSKKCSNKSSKKCSKKSSKKCKKSKKSSESSESCEKKSSEHCEKPHAP